MSELKRISLTNKPSLTNNNKVMWQIYPTNIFVRNYYKTHLQFSEFLPYNLYFRVGVIQDIALQMRGLYLYL